MLWKYLLCVCVMEQNQNFLSIVTSIVVVKLCWLYAYNAKKIFPTELDVKIKYVMLSRFFNFISTSKIPCLKIIETINKWNTNFYGELITFW